MCRSARKQYPVALSSHFQVQNACITVLHTNALCRQNSAYTAICCINLSEFIWYLDQWQVMHWPMAVECLCSSRLNLGMPKISKHWTARDHAILQAVKQTNAHSLLYSLLFASHSQFSLLITSNTLGEFCIITCQLLTNAVHVHHKSIEIVPQTVRIAEGLNFEFRMLRLRCGLASPFRIRCISIIPPMKNPPDFWLSVTSAHVSTLFDLVISTHGQHPRRLGRALDLSHRDVRDSWKWSKAKSYSRYSSIRVSRMMCLRWYTINYCFIVDHASGLVELQTHVMKC